LGGIIAGVGGVASTPPGFGGDWGLAQNGPSQRNWVGSFLEEPRVSTRRASRLGKR
jgi:hypothetical protein